MDERNVPLKLESKDGISRARFSPFNDAASKDMLAVSSWDSSVHVYNTHDTATNRKVASYKHAAAVLDCTFGPSVQSILSGGLDLTLVSFDATTSLETKVGTHEKAISCVEYSQEASLAVTGSWDKSLKLWDTRMPNALVQTVSQPDKVFSMDTYGLNVIIALNRQHVRIHDLRKLSQDRTHVLKETASPMKFQTRCVRAFPDSSGYALGSIEGRVAVDYFDVQGPSSKFAFRCHREEGKVYPVNAISFHPVHCTFATGGCDGSVSVWDARNKKKVSQFRPGTTSIADLSFNCDGTKLAVACSYTFEAGPLETTPPDVLFVRAVKDEEVKPKPRKK